MNFLVFQEIISLLSEEFHQIAQAGLKLAIFHWDYEYTASLPAHGDMVKRTATCETPFAFCFVLFLESGSDYVSLELTMQP